MLLPHPIKGFLNPTGSKTAKSLCGGGGGGKGQYIIQRMLDVVFNW
jgi:hypothetical protein